MNFNISEKLTKLVKIIRSSSKDINTYLSILLTSLKPSSRDYMINYLKSDNNKYILSLTIDNEERFSSIDSSSVDLTPKEFTCNDRFDFSTNIKGKTYSILCVLDVLVNKQLSNYVTNNHEPKIKLVGHNILYYTLNNYNVYNRIEGSYNIDLSSYSEVVKRLIMKHLSMNVTIIDTTAMVYQNYKLVGQTQSGRYQYAYKA
jgi:hypothetical protein